ncbi:MAG TPA: ATP-binding protein [Candidatus Onthomonas avicola]|nr:ATP-binding protein [Candidatus Onthomonas avicola]
MASRKAMLDSIVRQISTKLFLQNLACFLLLDIVVFFLMGYSSWAWRAMCTVEFIILAIFLNQNSKLIRSMLAPLEAMGETADVLGQSELRPEDLECLISRLDNINVSHLGSRVNLPQSRELAGLTRAINAMLERIDQGYQAQARFVSDASHELRTPIAVIQGYANLLNRWGKDNPAARQEAIDAIVQESESMARMVDQLLFLTRGDNDTQTVRLEQVDLTLLADEVGRETELLGTGRTVVTRLEPLVLVQADPGLVKQALRVLVDNAVKYTAPGDEIRITLHEREGYARLAVSDSGQGIAPAELAAVFRRFYRTEESRSRQTGGTGLGLSIAQWIAQRHRGWIEVLSRPGAGSRFTLVLPVEKKPERSPEAP